MTLSPVVAAVAGQHLSNMECINKQNTIQWSAVGSLLRVGLVQCVAAASLVLLLGGGLIPGPLGLQSGPQPGVLLADPRLLGHYLRRPHGEVLPRRRHRRRLLPGAIHGSMAEVTAVLWSQRDKLGRVAGSTRRQVFWQLGITILLLGEKLAIG